VVASNDGGNARAEYGREGAEGGEQNGPIFPALFVRSCTEIFALLLGTTRTVVRDLLVDLQPR